MLTAFILVCLGLLVVSTISISRAATFERDENRGWRISFAASACLYQEKVNGTWEQSALKLQSEGYAISVLRIPSVDQWHRYPAWAAGRRDEILGRVKSEIGKRLRFEPEPVS